MIDRINPVHVYAFWSSSDLNHESWSSHFLDNEIIVSFRRFTTIHFRDIHRKAWWLRVELMTLTLFVKDLPQGVAETGRELWDTAGRERLMVWYEWGRKLSSFDVHQTAPNVKRGAEGWVINRIARWWWETSLISSRTLRQSIEIPSSPRASHGVKFSRLRKFLILPSV
jgi:hypothetical protein